MSEGKISDNARKANSVGNDLSAGESFLGERIRGLRKRQGLTLAQLARLSELSVGYISQLERDLSRPSVDTLLRIGRCLGVNIQWFFSTRSEVSEADAGYVVRKGARQNIHYDDGIYDQLLTPSPSGQIEMVHSRFPPGAYNRTSYTHEGEEVGYVLSGAFELWVGDKHFLLGEGDSFRFASNEPHRYGNPGETDAVVLWVITPPTY
ncbi:MULTISPECIES: helix-turn-helix domain-containing protein [unclassified Pseudomonas]|uniref:helix-turn-helix domain-containing protein n=1 Tax=unclassified Pseudomonas TaxID=196821 RepID=UPI0025E709E0|nr:MULTISPECIES: cupin domain-containing protein [unclassified Pseudomonas]